MSSIDTKLDMILERLEKMEKRLDLTSDDCSRMGTHIDFVEEVYDKLRHPLQYISGQRLSPYNGNLSIE